MRQALRLAHRWGGLTLGLVLVLLGLTGSALVVSGTLERPPSRWPAMPDASPAQAVIDALHAAHPQRTGPWRLELPVAAGGPWRARYDFPEENPPGVIRPLRVDVDPATLRVAPAVTWRGDAYSWLYDLHFQLLLGPAGNYWLGGAAAFLLLLLGTGAWLWWPARRSATHESAGLAALPTVGVLVFTGLCLSLPVYIQPMVGTFSSLYSAPYLTAAPVPAGQRLPLDRLVAVAQARFPEARVRWIHVPGEDSGVVMVRMQQPGEPSPRYPRTMVWIDSGTGGVLAVRDPRQHGAGDGFLAWLLPLHDGTAFGWAGRIAVFLSGLLPLVLFISGWRRWRGARAIPAVLP